MIAQPGLLGDVAYKPRARVKTLPVREQPAYRVAAQADACTLAELLAVIVGGQEQIEVAERLLERFTTIQQLAQAHPQQIASVNGIGQQTALRLKAALALARKLTEPQDGEPVRIHSPHDAYQALRPLLEGREQERLVVLALDTRNTILDAVEVYKGAVNSAQIRVAELLRPCVQINAVGMLLGHNHPSGDPSPSPEDISVTRAVREAGKLMDIVLMDHIIVGSPGRYTSLKEKGLGF